MLTVGCERAEHGPADDDWSALRVAAPRDAFCEVDVQGAGTLDLETEYLPAVIQCENGGANLEALKAQAIAARSVAYYNMATEGSICDSQACQVFSCGKTPEPIQIQAVEETAGQYLKFGSVLTYGFYVAGDTNTASTSCRGNSGPTEGFVTYNEGASGTTVEQSSLGFINQTSDADYGQNRGCMSQWGARCLENNHGRSYIDILRFYYGSDIEVAQASGICVNNADEAEGTRGDDDDFDDDDFDDDDLDDDDFDGDNRDNDSKRPESPESDEGEELPADNAADTFPFVEVSGDVEGGCACSQGGPKHGRWALSLALIGLLFVRRRQ